MIRLVTVIAARSGTSATWRLAPVGDAPYRIVPGRTQSRCARGCHSTAAEFDSVRSPGRPCVAASNTLICQSISPSSAFAKCIISAMRPIDGAAAARSHAARNACGR
ncbi:hypothetical protein DO70_5998 [Burkholderia pseudomallei]|nr:hypothetical protein DO70_5998 [Burkholderia pseudomallei]